MKTFTLSCLAALTSANDVGGIDFESIGKIEYDLASYIELGKFNNEDFLLISEFDGAPWASGSVALVPGIKDAVKNGNVSDLKAHTLDPTPYDFENPNNASFVPADVFEGEHAIIVPDGFLIIGHRDGGVYLLLQDEDDLTKTKKTVKLTRDINNYWYHTGHWIDMNGDGRKDLLIARSNGKKNGGELVWLEHPAEGAFDGEWTDHKICDGPDVFTSIDVLPQYPNEVVVWASQYFDEALAVYRVSTQDGTLVDKRTIDDTTILHAYSAKLVDLNGDGQKQLLVNNWERDGDVNGVWAYTVPDDLITGTFEKYDIATGFDISWKYFFSFIGGPGYPYTFYPDGNEVGRANILLCGHGNQSAWLLTPTGDASKFEYERHEIIDGHGVIGSMDTADFDEDGYLEVYMTNYEKGYVQVFKTSPAAPSFLQQ